MREKRRLIERYISTTQANVGNPSNLPVISDEAFAMCDFMQLLADKIERFIQLNG